MAGERRWFWLAILLVATLRSAAVRADVQAEASLPQSWLTVLSTMAPPAVSTYTYRAVDTSALTPGEYLSFVIKWGVISGGYADLVLRGPETVGGRPAFHLISEAHSSGFVETFYQVQDRHDIWLDAQALITLRYDKRVNEGNYRIQEHNVLYPDRNWYVMNSYRFDKKIYEHNEGLTPPDVLDVLGALYYVRTQPLEVGRSFTIDVISTDKIYPLIVKVLKREKISVPAGNFDCFRVQPLIRSRDVFVSKGKKLEVWLTADKRHMPVRMRSEVVIGHVSAELLSEHIDPATH